MMAVCCHLTTPEEAQAFLAAMRNKSHQREVLHRPPSNLTSDGMDAWYLYQKQRERELRERRKEAEEILRGYRGSLDPSSNNHNSGRLSLTGGTSPRSLSEALDDPAKMSLPFESEQAKRQQNYEPSQNEEEEGGWAHTEPHREEKKLDDLHALQEQIDSQEELEGPQPSLSNSIPQTAEAPTELLSPQSEYETVWREFISPFSKFPPEPGRYHLYLSYACPGSHRALIVRTLKGLEDVISVTYVHPTWRLSNPYDPNDKHRGWVFGDPNGEPFPNTIGRGGPFPASFKDNEPDPEFNAYSIREIYERSNDTSGKYTIPLLWDKKLKTIVNNESSDIAYMLNSCFNDFATYPDVDLYTEYDEEGMAKLNEVSEWLSPLMIHGVYRCGFAKNQMAYDKAIRELCDAYDRADDILSVQRYLTGDTLTDADIRLFVTLIRFDEVYAFYFKTNARLVMLTPSLLNFCRDIYQIPGIAETCDMDQIKAHFYGSHAEWNKYSVVPRGLGFMELLDMPHDRDQLPAPDAEAEFDQEVDDEAYFRETMNE